MSVQYDKHWYEIIVSLDIGSEVYWVEGVNPSDALIKYCKYTEEIRGARMEAVCSLCLESAIELANEWLDDEIVIIHELGDVIYGNPTGVVTEIK